MRKWKQLIIAALTLLLVTTVLWGMPQNVLAETVKPAPELHSQQEIINYIKNHKATMSDKVEYFSDYFTPNYTTPPYSSGSLSDKTIQSALNLINQIRYIAGIPEIEYYSNYDWDMQCAALLCTINQTTSRQQEMPAGMDEDLYYFGARALDWNWVHMALGYENLNTAIVKEWTGNSSTAADMAKLEKRRGILNPKMTETCFGAVGNAYSIYTQDGLLGYRVNGVAWPAVEMPVEYFDPGFCWSYCMGKWVDPNGVSVILTKESTGQQWYFNKSRTDGYFAVDNDDSQQQGYLIFQPRNLTYAPGDIFSVQIGTAADFISYPVEFFSIGDAGETEFEPLQNGVGKTESVKEKSWFYYSFTAPSAGTYRFSAEGAAFTDAFLYSSGTMEKEELLGDASDGSNIGCVITAALAKNQTVYLEIEAEKSMGDDFTVWVSKQQTITYDANGAWGFDGAKDEIAYYGRMLQLPHGWGFQKYGYKLEGWYTSPTGGTKLEDDSYLVTGDRTFYAHWTPILQIDKQPEPVKVTAGETATFRVEATGKWPEYQWQKSADGGKTWVNSTSIGATTSTLTMTTKESYNGLQFRCAVTDNYNVTVNSQAATLTVEPDRSKLTVGKILTDTVDSIYKTYHFTAPADGTYSFETKSSIDTLGRLYTDAECKNEFNYDDDTGEGKNFKLIKQMRKGETVWLVVIGFSSGYGKEYGVLVSRGPVILFQPASVTVVTGKTVSMNVLAAGEGMTYQWQYQKADRTDWVASTLECARTNNYSFKANSGHNGMKIRCVVTDETGCKATSEEAIITVTGILSITSQPVNVTVNSGATATFKIAAAGTGLKYQWKKSTDGGKTWVNSASTGATTDTLTMTAKDSYNGLKFKCVVTDGSGKTVASTVATLTVKTTLTITTQPANVTAASGATATFKVAATGSGLKYQWKKSSDGGKTWVNSSSTGAATNTLSMTTKDSYNGLKFKCVVTDGSGKTVTSNAVTLTVKTALAITTQPASVTAASGATATFKVAATGNNLKYQWQKSTDGGSTWVNSSSTGATTNTLTMTTKASYNGLKFRCKVSDGTTTKYSNTVTLTVK